MRRRKIEPIDDYFLDYIQEGTMRRLLSSAVDVFAQKGFHAATTREISVNAGMSPAALYLHYKSKEEMLATICRAVPERLLVLLNQCEADHVDARPTERLRALAAILTSFHTIRSGAVLVANRDYTALTGTARKHVMETRRSVERVFERCLQDGAEAGEFDIADLRVTTLAILSLGISVSRWYKEGRRLAGEDIAAIHAEASVRMVLPCRKDPAPAS